MHNNTENSHYIEKSSIFCKDIIRFHFLIGCVQKEEQILKHMQINLNVAILQNIFAEKLCIDRPVCHMHLNFSEPGNIIFQPQSV